jgi:UDPglucose 6-dehydrogenase
VSWTFHPTRETELVEFVASYWRALGVKVSIHHPPTSCKVSISSRMLAAWFAEVLRLGVRSYAKRIPDIAWTLPIRKKQALLRGLWDGDGSWSRVNGGPSVVLEYGTVSRELADGMLRLLGDLGICARLRIGRGAKSTTDTYWLVISGADQVNGALFLLPPDERPEVLRSMIGQSKRIRPTGYRPLLKNASWVRVTGIAPVAYDGSVYSVEVPEAHTVVTTFGVIAHNCFPKESKALVHIAEEAGYDFGLLRGVIDVNNAQFERVVDKVEQLVGGSLSGTTVAVWGLTFKARTDDMRDSPSLAVIARMVQRGARVRAFDPAVKRLPDASEGVEVCADPYAACDGAAVVVVLTEWDDFRWLDFDKVATALTAPRIVDARNLLDPAKLRRRGFEYVGIGR